MVVPFGTRVVKLTIFDLNDANLKIAYIVLHNSSHGFGTGGEALHPVLVRMAYNLN